MEIRKIKNNHTNCYDFELIKDGKILQIFYAGNLDLYMKLGNGSILPENENISIYFDITKENYEIYSIFDSLYNDIIKGRIFDEEDPIYFEYNNYIDNTKTYEYKKLVDENQNINWISDDGPAELEDMMSISYLDEDTYRLTFARNDKPMDIGFKSGLGITVRIRNSGSSYSPFNCIFMRMYKKLQEIDPNYHQIHLEEIKYAKKLIKDK